MNSALATQLFMAFARTATAMPRFILEIGAQVSQALQDGSITPDEAQVLAVKISVQRGDMLKLHIRGRDVLDQQIQDNLAAAIGRLTANVIAAVLRSPAS